MGALVNTRQIWLRGVSRAGTELTRVCVGAALLVSVSSAPAFAQDDDTDEDVSIDDLIGDDADDSDSGETEIAEERREMEEQADRDRGEEVALPSAKDETIITRQPKPFVKLNRVEIMPFVGYVPNDPFIHRIMFGAGLGFHVTEIFQIELQGSFAPNFDRGDWKPVTAEITAQDVAPKISRQIGHLVMNFNFSPFYGKVVTRKGSILFDIYGTFGVGMVFSEDDPTLIYGQNNPSKAFIDTQNQVSPALTAGAGLRILFNKTFALRFEGRTISYVNTIESSELEIKNNLALLIGPAIFFGRRSE